MPSRTLTVPKIIMVPADIDERRRQLFQPEGMVRLTEEEYDVYWPWVKWLWNQQAVKLKNKTRWYRCKFSDRRKTIRGRKKAPASNYYNCRCALKVVHKDWIGWEFSQTSTSLGHNHDIDSDLPPEVIDLGTHVRLEVMDGRTPTTISNNITNTRTVVQRPLDNILPLGRIGINGSGEVACPLTKIFNCAETFPHPYPAMMHARIHIGGDVPCPWADELNCSRIFRRSTNAQHHAIEDHRRPIVYACRFAGTTKCAATFISIREMEYHQREVHQGRSPCPFGEEYQCFKTFGNFSLATDHGRIHTGERIPCPYAEEDSCSKLFMRKADLKKHVEGDHDRRRYQCPFAKDVNCTRTFGRADSARSHAKSSHGRGWLCTVPLCRMAVSRVPVRRVAIRKHMLAHKAKGHLEGLEERPEPIRVPFKALLRDQDPSADDVLEQTIADGVTDGDGPCPPEDDPTNWFQSFLNGDPFSIERRAGTRAWNDTILSTSAP
jgi:hypothetical protein